MIRTHGRRKGSNSQYIRTRSHNHRSDSNSWPKYTSTYCITIRTHDSTRTFWVKKLLQFAVFKHIWKSSVKLMKLLYFSTTSIDFFYSHKSRFSRLMPSENINWYYSVAESRAGAEFEFSNQGAGADHKIIPVEGWVVIDCWLLGWVVVIRQQVEEVQVLVQIPDSVPTEVQFVQIYCI